MSSKGKKHNAGAMGRKGGARWALLVLALGLLAVTSVPVYAGSGSESEPYRDPATGAWFPSEAGFVAFKLGVENEPYRDPGTGAWFPSEAAYVSAKQGVQDEPYRDPSTGAWFSSEADYLATKRGIESEPYREAGTGAWFPSEAAYVAFKSGTGNAASSDLSDELSRFHQNKPVSDPANGALSLAQAAFYVKLFSRDGADKLVKTEADTLQ